MLLLALLTPALAGPPSAVVLDSQAIEGSVSVRLSVAEALAGLADPTWVKAMDGGSTTVAVRERVGDCLIADYVSPSAVMTVRYTVRQCPTAQGVRSTLVSSDGFSTYTAEWIVAPEPTGSLLTYRLEVAPSLPIPVSFITGTIRREILAMMQRFGEKYGVPG